MNGTVTGVTICLGMWRATRRRSGWNSLGDTRPVLRQVSLECDAVSAVQGANQLDRPPVDVEGTAIEQQHRHGRRRLQQRRLAWRRQRRLDALFGGGELHP